MLLICQYCGRNAEKVSSKDFYGVDYGTFVHVCRSCDAYVGTHKITGEPLGTLANKELRELRKISHMLFDPLWRDGAMTRDEAYEWLQKNMNLTSNEAHIGKFDLDQCRKLITIINNQEKH